MLMVHKFNLAIRFYASQCLILNRLDLFDCIISEDTLRIDLFFHGAKGDGPSFYPRLSY